MQDFATGTGTGIGAAVTGSAKTATQLAKDASVITNPLQFFSSSAFWVRAGEVLLGIVLIAAGTAKLAETSQLAKSIVTKTPLGHIAKAIR